jgi:hypothetical protein
LSAKRTRFSQESLPQLQTPPSLHRWAHGADDNLEAPIAMAKDANILDAQLHCNAQEVVKRNAQ